MVQQTEQEISDILHSLQEIEQKIKRYNHSSEKRKQ